MKYDLLFSIANSTALIGWGFLIVLPGNTVTKIFIHSGLVSFSISGLYLFFVLSPPRKRVQKSGHPVAAGVTGLRAQPA